MCKIGGKARYFVKIGTWSKDHPSLTPRYIWRKSSSIKIPKLRVEKLAQEFAAQVGLMDLSAVFDPFYEAFLCAPTKEDCRTDGEEEDEAEDEAGSKARESEEEDEMNQVQQGSIFDAIEYPLLHSLGFCKHEMVDWLIQELVKFSGKLCSSFK